MNHWVMRDGRKIQVKDMELSHVKNTLKMLIRKYNRFCLIHGARKVTDLRIDEMGEDELRSMLNLTCADRVYLKRLVSNECFGYDIFSEIMTCSDNPV